MGVKMGLREYLEDMELKDPGAFMEQLKDFSQKCLGSSRWQVWILWVPVTETKEEIGYADQQSSLMAQIEQKVPTEKQMQQLKEKMGTWGEDDDNLFTRPSPSDPHPRLQPQLQPQQPAVGISNRKGRGSSATAAAQRPLPETMPTTSMAIEAAKFKKNTVKDRTFVDLSKQLSLGDWKLRNKEYQEMLTQDGFLTGEIGDQIDSCFTYGYVDFVRAAGALGLWAQGLRSCGHLAPASSSYKLMSTLPPSHCVNNSKAMEKIIRDEKLHQKKEEERLKKQDDKPLGKILTKEKEREEKRLKKEQAAESKKRKAAEAAEAKKAAKPSGRRRKSKRGQHEDSAASDDPAADGSKAKAAKVSRTRAKGSFEETDPPVLVKGSMFPAAYRLGFFESFNDFLDEVVCNKPAVMRNKKGSVKKVLAKSLNRNDPQEETKDFITQTAKAFGVQQASAKSDLQKQAARGPVRKNKTVPQEKEVAMFLGFDLLLKAKLVARGDGPGGDDSGEAGDTGEPENQPWLLTNAEAKSLDTVKNKILGACWTSFGQSNVWAGFFSTGLGHMYYQQEGNKALSMMHFGHLYDVKQQVDKKLVANSDDGGDGGSSEDGIRQLTAWFQNLSPETVSSIDTAERGRMSTLRYIYLTPGDILFVPADIMVEKSMNSNSLGFRFPTMLMHGEETETLDLLDEFVPMNSLLKGWQKILWTEDRKSMEGLDDADPTQLPCLDSDSDEEETTGKVKKEQQAESQSDLEDALEKQMEQDYPKDFSGQTAVASKASKSKSKASNKNSSNLAQLAGMAGEADPKANKDQQPEEKEDQHQEDAEPKKNADQQPEEKEDQQQEATGEAELKANKDQQPAEKEDQQQEDAAGEAEPKKKADQQPEEKEDQLHEGAGEAEPKKKADQQPEEKEDQQQEDAGEAEPKKKADQQPEEKEDQQQEDAEPKKNADQQPAEKEDQQQEAAGEAEPKANKDQQPEEKEDQHQEDAEPKKNADQQPAEKEDQQQEAAGEAEPKANKDQQPEEKEDQHQEDAEPKKKADQQPEEKEDQHQEDAEPKKNADQQPEEKEDQLHEGAGEAEPKKNADQHEEKEDQQQEDAGEAEQKEKEQPAAPKEKEDQKQKEWNWRSRRSEQPQKKTASATAKKKDSLEVEVELPTVSH
ncbi:unnamed protein product [Cladocopium goreaui]|uniref:Uncharacterized protein n=1 Tax=Cladocopium goreaui TaxID=2562237 RepID=A0A9P1GDX4_9DINO|nr:unnamed protein product [Cladocopium goreaui]